MESAPPLSFPRVQTNSAAAKRSTANDFGPRRGGTGLFFMSSVIGHLGLLAIFSSAPDQALATARPTEQFEVDLLEPERPPKAVPESIPLGALQAPPLPHKTARKIRGSQRPPPLVPPTQPTLSSTPEVIHDNNPYGSVNPTVFTSGTAAHGSVRVVRAASVAPPAQPAPSFGTENGAIEYSAEKAEKLRAWHARVRAQLARLASQVYPHRAQKLGQQGTTRIAVRIDARGRILSASLASPSGHASLDRAALSGLRSIQQVPAPPKGTGPSSLMVPVTFRLL